MTKHSPQEITRIAVETAFDEFRREGINETATHFLHLLKEALEEHERTIVIHLITPTGDAGTLAKTIADLIEKRYHRPVSVIQEADPSMIGGVIISFGDERLDLSVRATLRSYARALKVPSSQ